MSKSNDRKIVKPYLMKINSKMFRNQQAEEPENLRSNYIIKNSARHTKCKSGNNFKGVGDYVKSYQVNMYPMASPNSQGSFGKVSHKYANSISNLEFSESNFESHQIPPHFTIDERKRELNLKYDIAINSLKEKSAIAKKNEKIMSKYSRENNRKDEFQFALKSSASSNSQQQKCLKFKKSQIQKSIEPGIDLFLY